jgi:hypothetical protein
MVTNAYNSEQVSCQCRENAKNRGLPGKQGRVWHVLAGACARVPVRAAKMAVVPAVARARGPTATPAPATPNRDPANRQFRPLGAMRWSSAFRRQCRLKAELQRNGAGRFLEACQVERQMERQMGRNYLHQKTVLTPFFAAPVSRGSIVLFAVPDLIS